MPWLVGACLLALGACTEETASVSEMETAIAARLAQVPDGPVAAGPQVDLSRGFATALRTAVLASPAYRSAQAQEAEAFADMGVAQSVRAPQVSASGTLGAARETAPVNETTAGISANVTLTQIIYDGGASQGAINRATANALAARAGRVERGNLIALEAARSWLELWQGTARLGLLENRTGNLGDLMDQMDRMAANGLVDRASVESAKQQVLDIALEKAAISSDLATARVQFAGLFQTDRTNIGRPDAIVSASLIRARADAWQTGPSMQRAAAELIAAQRAADEARAAFRPTVSLRAGVSEPLDDREPVDLNGGLFVQYVFADGGRRGAVLEAAINGVAAQEAGLAATQSGTAAEIETGLARLASLERSLALITQKMRLSTSEAEIARSQIRTGQANLRQLISAEIESYRATDRKLQLEAEILLLQLTIAARSGYLTSVIGLEP